MPTLLPLSANHVRIHYQRPDGNYAGWTVYAFDDTTEDTAAYGRVHFSVAGMDDYGAYFDVGIISNAQNLGIIIHNPSAPGGDEKDPGPNQFVNPSGEGSEYWALSGVDALYASRPDAGLQAGTVPAGYARIHYYRRDDNYRSWTVYAFDDTEEPTNNYAEGPLFPTGTDSYGAFYDVTLTANPKQLGLIVHEVETGEKDPGADMYLDVSAFNEGWVISGDATVYTARPSPAQLLNGGFSKQQALWIDRTTVAIQRMYLDGDWSYGLAYSPRADLKVTATGTLSGAADMVRLNAYADGLTSAQVATYPQLATYAVFHLEVDLEIARLKEMLKGQLALAATDTNGTLKYLTGVQQAGVLDDLLYYSGELGVSFGSGVVKVSLWAPTAQSVNLLLFSGEEDNAPELSVVMEENDGIWSAAGDSSWRGKFYLFDVFVYVPSLHVIAENIVTDPYSVDLALNGTRSRITDLKDPATKPDGWDESSSPALRSKSDFSVYEMHLRDFSSNDPTVREEYRGTYLAFADPQTTGMRHLKALAEAGLKAVHLLPTFHFASVNEDKSTWKQTGDLSAYPADSDQQQAAVARVQAVDAYNWGYDPVHYMAPHGSYAVNPGERVKEYRQMVLGLHQAGLRVVQDQVFNHTDAAGQDAFSVLDKIVPGYYHRLNANGTVEEGSCCPDTASEHRMMEKLMIDTLVQNAREYKIDGFRFDLMSFHFVYNMEHIQEALSELTLAQDGVDGPKIYLYGEGWETGETANNALGPNASQRNMYGTGIGTFNDRIRDGIRGGGPFGDVRMQGFATGLFTHSSEYTNENQATYDQQRTLLRQSDWIKAGLAGNLRDFRFENSAGEVVSASQINYGGQTVGYTASPLEAVNFCSVHDNQNLFDAVQLKSPIPGTTANGGDDAGIRSRRQVLAMSLIALGQGVPFFLAGDDVLHSKGMDTNSYNSGDWFNKLDFSYQSNNWGVGLPIAGDNQNHWQYMKPLLKNAALKPAPAHIAYARDAFRELLQIRDSSLLFRMETLDEVQNNMQFLNNGPWQIPGLIVMTLDSNGRNYGGYQRLLVVFNATRETVRFQNDGLKNYGFHLHPVQASSSDAAVRGSGFDAQTGVATVSPLTTAVFVTQQ